MTKSTTAHHLGPFEYEGASIKAHEAQKLREDIEAFKANGGKIEVLKHGEGKKIHEGKSRQSMNRAQRAHASKKRQKVGALPGDSNMLGYVPSKISVSIEADTSIEDLDDEVEFDEV